MTEYVIWDGKSLLVRAEVMDELGLKPGQTVDFDTFGLILEKNLACSVVDVALARQARKS